MKHHEYWRDIPGTGGKYQASRNGEVRHVWPNGNTTMLSPYLLHSKCKRHCRYRLHIHMRVDGKDKVVALLSVMAMTWMGAAPPGMVWHHANGNMWDNRVENIKPITRQALGKKTGALAARKSVEMLDAAGNVVELYTSAREAGRANNMSYQAVIDRCHGKVKKPFALTGYTFRYEDEPYKQGGKAAK
ncbi:MAG: hypothetical protein IKK75_13895 [Clostridia bacterium]|nr:hypothetical protein [Clostridia bacterium]